MSSIACIADALAAIPDRELRELRAILDDETVSVRGLLAWLEVAISWEISRRAGACHELVGPRAEMRDESDVECSLVTLAVMHAQLRNIAGVANFLDVTADTLCDEVR